MHLENARLILTCGFPELVILCTVICSKIPHSCKDTKMGPHLIFTGACHKQKTGTITKTYDERVSMCVGHVSACLCSRCYFCFFPFSRRRLRYFVFSALDFGDLKCYHNHSSFNNLRDCPCLFYMLTNMSWNQLGLGTPLFWLHLLLSSSHNRLYPVEYCLELVEKKSEGKIHKSLSEPRNRKLCKYCLLLYIGEKKICVFNKMNCFSPISFFNFLSFISSCEKITSTSSMYFQENKSFMLHTFARKTKVSSYKHWCEK